MGLDRVARIRNSNNLVFVIFSEKNQNILIIPNAQLYNLASKDVETFLINLTFL